MLVSHVLVTGEPPFHWGLCGDWLLISHGQWRGASEPGIWNFFKGSVYFASYRLAFIMQ